MTPAPDPTRPYVLGEATWPAVREARYQVAVLPWGATEAHNRHLPYGTDTVETERVAAESARRACDAGARGVVRSAPAGHGTAARGWWCSPRCRSASTPASSRSRSAST